MSSFLSYPFHNQEFSILFCSCANLQLLYFLPSYINFFILFYFCFKFRVVDFNFKFMLYVLFSFFLSFFLFLTEPHVRNKSVSNRLSRVEATVLEYLADVEGRPRIRKCDCICLYFTL